MDWHKEFVMKKHVREIHDFYVESDCYLMYLTTFGSFALEYINVFNPTCFLTAPRNHKKNKSKIRSIK